MRDDHKAAWRAVCEKAFRNIQKEGDLWRDWCNAKTDEDRELLIVEIVWHMAYEEGLNAIKIEPKKDLYQITEYDVNDGSVNEWYYKEFSSDEDAEKWCVSQTLPMHVVARWNKIEIPSS